MTRDPDAAPGRLSRHLVIDVEATCSSCRSLVPRAEMEIIEFGAVLLEAGQTLRSFSVFVQPVRHPVLTEYCTTLTSIRQEDVDSAPSFPEALRQLFCFSGPPEQVVFVSWGRFDARILKENCAFHGLPTPTFAGYLDLKRAICEALRLQRPLPIGEALQHCGMAFIGTPHRGLDDAKNAARLLAWLSQQSSQGLPAPRS